MRVNIADKGIAWFFRIGFLHGLNNGVYQMKKKKKNFCLAMEMNEETICRVGTDMWHLTGINILIIKELNGGSVQLKSA